MHRTGRISALRRGKASKHRHLWRARVHGKDKGKLASRTCLSGLLSEAGGAYWPLARPSLRPSVSVMSCGKPHQSQDLQIWS